MKTSLPSIGLVAAFMATLAACDDTQDNPYEHLSQLHIVSSDVIFPGSAARGDVVVSAPSAITATTASQWLTATVDGHTVHVAASANDRYDGRSAVLRISCGTDTVDVIVQQAGLEFVNRSVPAFITGDAAAERRFLMHATTDIRLSATADWLSARLEGDSLVVSTAANATGRLRQAWLRYSCGPSTDSISVTQASYGDLTGRYYLAGYLNAADGQPTSDIVELTTDDAGQPALSFPTFGWTWPAEFDEATLTLRLASGVNIGQYTDQEGTTSHVGTVMWDISREAIIYSRAVTMSATFAPGADGRVTARLADNGSWAASSCDAIRFELFRGRSITRANRMDRLVFALVSPFFMEAE